VYMVLAYSKHGFSSGNLNGGDHLDDIAVHIVTF
jgi:hypothetical protein